MKKFGIILFVFVLVAGLAGAATVTWSGSDTNWTQPDTNSWNATYNSGDIAQFSGAGSAVNIDPGGVTPGGVSITSGSYTFSGGSISGTGTLTKAGSGTLTLTGSNTYSGDTTISAGVLDVGDMSLGALSSSSLLLLRSILQGYGTFNRSIGTSAGDVSLSGSYNPGFSARGGKLVVNLNGTITRTFQFINTVYLNSATSDSEVEFQSGIANWGTTVYINVAAGINTNSFATVSGIMSGGGGYVKTGDGLLLLTGNNTYTNGTSTTINAGTLVAGCNALVSQDGAFGNGSSAVLLGDTTGSSDASLMVGGAFTIERAVTVQDGNTGVMSLGGNTDNTGTFSGAITMNKDLTVTQVATTGANTLQITGGISSGNAGAKTLTFNNGGAVTVSGSAMADGGGGTLALTKSGAGTLTLSGTNTYTGTTTINAGALALGTSGTLDADNNVVLAGGTLSAGNFSNSLGTLNHTASSTIALGSGQLAFANSSALAATWSGTLDLTGRLGATTLRFGTDNSGLTEAQVASFTYNGHPVPVILNAQGYIVPPPAGMVITVR